jgi:YbbR domain-containing protein
MRSFAKNLRTFLLALALGISVWVSAVSEADPNEVNTFPRPIPLEVVGLDPAFILAEDPPPAVEVRLRAPRSVWETLIAKKDSIRAVLDLTEKAPGDKRVVPIQLLISERPYQLVFMNPSTVTVNLESVKIKTFPLVLSLSGQPAAGYQAGAATKDVTEVTVSGPESVVERVARARVVLNLDNVRESIDVSLPIQVVDSENKLVQGLAINPENVQVNIPISKKGGFRDVAVKVVVQGQQAPGYRIENISVFPPVITIFADDPELVNTLPGVVETLPLDLQDRSEDISTRLSLDLPEKVTLVGAQTVQVQVSISPIQTSVTLPNLPIDVVGEAEGLHADVFPKVVDVIISGPVPVLEAISAQDITVSVNVAGREIGVYQLSPEVEILLENVSVQSILPSTVEVVIALPGTPTPTAFPP